MPHVILSGDVDMVRLAAELPRAVRRHKAAVLKTEEVWQRADGNAVLIEGVVVEHSRPLHPVAVISKHQGDTTVRLWRLASVERTPAVQRWLAHVARDVQNAGGGPVRATNLSSELIEEAELELATD